MSTPLTFKELPDGAKFISFPVEGDDMGHGGYRSGFNLFTKLAIYDYEKHYTNNAVRNDTGTLSHMPPDMQVILIL
jgi:hypothetical protein